METSIINDTNGFHLLPNEIFANDSYANFPVNSSHLTFSYN